MTGGKNIIACCAALGLSYTCYIAVTSKRLARWRRDMISKVLERTAESLSIYPEVQRTQFNCTPLIKRQPALGHSHGQSAADRSAASSFVDSYAVDIGRVPYFVQCSRADQRQGRVGSRAFYWTKDLFARQECYNPPQNALLALIDVDYYVDMEMLLVDEFKPTVLYTFQPEEVARLTSEYSYTFDAENRVMYNVSGGGRYHHHVWNYGVDHVRVEKKFLGITYCAATYLVDRRKAGPDHELVSFTPLRRWYHIWAYLSTWLEGNQLTRLKPVIGSSLRMQVKRIDALYVSTGIVGSYAHATIRSDFDDAIAISAITSTVKLSMPTVLGYVSEGSLEERKVQASALLLYHRNNAAGLRDPPMVFPLEESVRNYDYGVASFDPEAKSILKPFMTPLMHECYAPLTTLANEQECVRGRITQFANRGELRMTELLDKTMREFVTLLFPDGQSLHPTTIDEVYLRQNRPSQRHILDTSLVEDPHRLVKMFIKKEAYGSIKEPRPISTINGADKREYSRYIYPVADHLKSMEWYAFGKKPRQIADRVCAVLERSSSATNTDFSRFDGRVSTLLRELERLVLTRAYDPIYLNEIIELHNSQFNQPAVGRLGTKYNTGMARASGSPETAAFNSIANAYVAYLTLRTTREEGAFIGPNEAWERLGVYGGDDGLTADVDSTRYERAARMLGLVLETETIGRGCMGIKFLSRVYGPHVWYGDTNSCCDLPRQLSKLHTTVALPPNVTPSDKLLEKARAYYLTDKNTPVLGAFVSKVVELNGPLVVCDRTSAMRPWNSMVDLEDQYPNAPSDWMSEYASSSLGEFGFDFNLFDKWICSVETLSELLLPPLCCDPKAPVVKVPMVVENEVVAPLAQERGVLRATSKQHAKRSSTGRKQRPRRG